MRQQLITFVLCILSLGNALSAEDVSTPEESSPKRKTKLTDVVRRAYFATHDGWSSDEVVLQDSLNKAFLSECKKLLPDAKPGELNWALLNARKAGKLSGVKVTQRKNEDHSAYFHLAEIAARSCQDKFKISTDRIMCDPATRAAFDALAKQVAPKLDRYKLRKAAFALRKTRKLKPELVLRIADWDRKISSHSAASLRDDVEQIPKSPGIYIFRDKTGYLYIGEAINLRRRLADHLNQSDRQSLAGYLREHGVKDVIVELHVFPADSRARLVGVRRAYESELIDSRKPRFNVRP